MAQAMKPAEIDQLVDILAREAQIFPDGTEAFFQYIISRANLPPNWNALLANMGKATPLVDAPRLVAWAVAKGDNPADPGSTTLGSLLKALEPLLGSGDASSIKGLMKDYNL